MAELEAKSVILDTAPLDAVSIFLSLLFPFRGPYLRLLPQRSNADSENDLEASIAEGLP